MKHSIVLLALSLVVSSTALAHHAPGHGVSEGVRTINSLGRRGASAQTRLLWLNEMSTTSTSPSPGDTYSSSLYAEWAPWPEFSVGLQTPLLMVREFDQPIQAGYGDTRVALRYTPHADKLIHRVFTLGLSLSIPTRTLKLTVDPGAVWKGTLNVLFTRTYNQLFWQIMGLATIDTRPAGVGIDGGSGFQIGLRTKDKKISIGAGVLGELRLLNLCKQPQGNTLVCDGSRAGEASRDVGALRSHAVVTLAANLLKNSRIVGSVLLPLTSVADFDVATSLGWEMFF